MWEQKKTRKDPEAKVEVGNSCLLILSPGLYRFLSSPCFRESVADCSFRNHGISLHCICGRPLRMRREKSASPSAAWATVFM